MDVEDIKFSDDGIQRKGGSADIAKATAHGLGSIGPDDGELSSLESVAVKKFRPDGSVDSRTQTAVSLLRPLPS